MYFRSRLFTAGLIHGEMNNRSDIFYSKILLFGEYTLISGSGALTLPFRHFSAKLAEGPALTESQKDSNRSIRKFADYLNNQKKCLPEGLRLDIDSLYNDTENGLNLESDIPVGYGVGSSAALVASVYKKYGEDLISGMENKMLPTLKTYFSFMESFFHGRSSGFDPLSCYCGVPLLWHSSENIERVIYEELEGSAIHNIFLIDTRQSAGTGQFVNSYLEMTKLPEFRVLLAEKLIPANNRMIHSFLSGNLEALYTDMQEFSGLQLREFNNMIPAGFPEHWKEGILSGKFLLKLCGSGGGGFILGFSKEMESARQYFQNKRIPFLTVSKEKQRYPDDNME